jgi:hypothetical protein
MKIPTKEKKKKKKRKKRPVLVGIPIVSTFLIKKNQAQVPKTKVKCHKPR